MLLSFFFNLLSMGRLFMQELPLLWGSPGNIINRFNSLKTKHRFEAKLCYIFQIPALFTPFFRNFSINSGSEATTF